jgi:hypothetical protein
MAGKKWLTGHLPVWQMARVCVRQCVSSDRSERVAKCPIMTVWAENVSTIPEDGRKGRIKNAPEG